MCVLFLYVCNDSQGVYHQCVVCACVCVMIVREDIISVFCACVCVMTVREDIISVWFVLVCV